MFAVKVICLLLIAYAAVAHSDGLDRIVGGYDARQGQFPFVASVRTPQNQHLCGGVIISRRHILTAGHCVQRTMENPNLVVYVGAHTRTDGTPYRLSHAIRHPGFIPRVAINDISVLITANQIVFNHFVAAVPALPPIHLNDAASYTAFVAGLGFVRVPNLNGSGLPKVMQWKETQTISRQQYRQQIGSQQALWVHESSVCTVNRPGQGICSGDSGNPLVTREGVLIGIVTFGFCGRPQPEVYVRIFAQLGFIRSAINSVNVQ